MFLLVKFSFNLFQFPYSITTCHSLFLGDRETFFVFVECNVYRSFGPQYEPELNPVCPCANWPCVPLRTLASCIADVRSSLLFGSAVSHFTFTFCRSFSAILHPSVWAFSLLFCLLTGFADFLSHSCFFHSDHMPSHFRPFCFNIVYQDNAVGIATHYGLDGLGI